MAGDVLTLRQMNRATLARQLLLTRASTTPVEAVERIFGLQAQMARPAFVGLWSRIKRADRHAIAADFLDARLVRATMMRATLHVVSAADYQRFRLPLQPALDRAVAVLKDRARDFDVERLLRDGRAFFARPETFDAFRDRLASLYPNSDIRAMAYLVRTRLPLVQVPTDGAWGFPAQPAFVSAETWLKARVAGGAGLEALVWRYLEAFGPATVADVQAWSGLPALKPTLESMRPKLRTFASERRGELFDVPDAPRPPADTPAPVRFLPDWDNAIVSRSDERLLAREHRTAVFRPGLRVLPTVLVDGFVAGVWSAERKRGAATLRVDLFAKMPARTRTEIEEEAMALVRFVEPDASTTEVIVRASPQTSRSGS